MADKLADLVLRIRADSRQLQRELRSVEGRNRRATNKVAKQWSKASLGIDTASKKLLRFTGLSSALGAGFSLIALKGQVDQVLEFSDSIGKTALRLGISTDALQEFRFAAQQSGIAARTMDLALQRFTRGAGEAATGTGEAKDAIKELGLSLRGTDGQIRRTEDLFSDAIEALGEVDGPADKLRLAFKLFDSEGVSVLQMVDNFEALRAKARDLGVVIDEDTIKKAVDAKDEMSALSLVISANLAPTLVDISRGFVSFSEVVADASGDVRNFFAELNQDETERGLESRIEGAEQRVERLIDRLKDQSELFSKSPILASIAEAGNVAIGIAPINVNQIVAAQAEVIKLRDALAELRAAAKAEEDANQTEDVPDPQSFVATLKAIEAVEAQISALERLNAVQGDTEAQARVAELIEIENKARAKSIDLTTEDGKRLLELSLKLGDLKEAQQAAKEESAAFANAQNNLNSILSVGDTELEKYAEKIERLRADLDAGRITTEQFIEAQAALKSQLEDVDVEPIKKGFEELDVLGRGVFDGLAGALADFVLGAEVDLDKLVKSFERAFLMIVIKQIVLTALSGGSGGGGGILGGILNAFGGGAAGIGGAAPGGSGGGGSLPASGFAASGGPIAAGVPVVVGEKGPEIIVPRMAGFVIPNSALRVPSPVGFMGSSAPIIAPPASVSVTVINETNGQASVQERTGPSGRREIQVLISQAVAGEIAQGGPIARSIDARLGVKPKGV